MHMPLTFFWGPEWLNTYVLDSAPPPVKMPLSSPSLKMGGTGIVHMNLLSSSTSDAYALYIFLGTRMA